MRLTRSVVIQGLLDLYGKDASYLEIGVSNGRTFGEIEANPKIGVDPRLDLDTEYATDSSESVLYQLTSDEYFGTVREPDEKFEVIFLDGLHTFEQTLRDLLNALDALSPNGVIVIDDIRPTSSMAAISDRAQFQAIRKPQGGESGAWMGDVYRLVFFLDSFFQQLSYRTVSENHGQLVVWRQRRRQLTQRQIRDIARLSYEEMLLFEQDFRPCPYDAIVQEVRSAVCARD